MRLLEGEKLPTLDATRIRLRWIEQSDVPALFSIFSDPRAMRYWSSPPWAQEAQGAAMVQSVHEHFRKGTLYQWGMTEMDETSIIGTCTLANVDVSNRRAEIGFVLHHDYWGRGFMSEAVSCLLAYAFESLDLHRIEADVDPRNASSIRLLENLGFQKEGLMKERWIVGGEMNDTLFLGMLRKAWMATQDK